jgi:pimeloyl-ACP methyl ester carboxylesterase
MGQYASKYDANLTGFSVDEIARDNINLALTLKQSNQSVYLFGRGIGSYIVHRMLQIDGSMIDAVIMDGGCIGAACNASDWDIQRGIMQRQLLAKPYSRYSEQPLSLFNRLMDRFIRGLLVCGIPVQQNPTRVSIFLSYMLFDPSLRPAVYSSLYQLYRCQVNDFGDGIYWYDNAYSQSPVTNYFKCQLNTEPRLLTSHIIMSELYDWSSTARPESIYGYTLQAFVSAARDAGWKRYVTSPYRNSIANFSKPILVMNGEFDPQAPLDRAKPITSQLGATLVVMPGMTGNTFMLSNTNTSTTTCGMQLVSQFLSCPTCTLDASCVQSMMGYTTDSDALTRSVLGDVWANYPAPIQPVDTTFAVLYAILIPFNILIFVLLIIFAKHRRVLSRLAGPHIGQVYIFAFLIVHVIFTAGARTSLPYQQLGTTVEQVLLIAACTVIFIQLIRFFSLKRIYTAMNDKNTNSIIRLYKVLVSWQLFVVVLAVTLVFWTVFGIIMAITSEFYGYYTIYAAFRYCALAYASVIALIAVVILVVDICMNLSLRYFTDDLLLYRVDSLFILPIVAFAIIGNAPVSSVPAVAYPVNFVFLYMFIILMMFFFGGNICIACIVDVLRGRVVTAAAKDEARTDEELIRDILADPVCEKHFQFYCSAEFSLENVIAYVDIEQTYSKIDQLSGSQLEEALASINTKYMLRSSEMELNTPSEVGKSFQKMLAVPVTETYDRKKVLKVLLESIMVNILDTFSRFKVAPAYSLVMETLQVKTSIKSQTDLEQTTISINM